MVGQFLVAFIQILIAIILFDIQASKAQTSCQIFNSQGRIASVQNDEFYQILIKEKSCPQNIDGVNQLLNTAFQNRKFLVANRGRNNSSQGSFSIFESFASQNRNADAGIFLGHFTQMNSHNGKSVIDLDQLPDLGKLVIELIAWDKAKGYYNFYELIGQGNYSQWFYRGDSKDILVDNQFIYLNNTPQKPPIGQTLRCSGCHTSGGPIMKEITFPHNDWWTKSRPLVFEAAQSNGFLNRLRVIDSAENFATQVQAGIQKLEKSASYQNVKKSLGLRAQLRPLFCDLEINLVSDVQPSQSASGVQIPSSALAGPFAGNLAFSVPRSSYAGMLQKYRMQFPENKQMDADHAWLSPVKGYSDLVAIGHLKDVGLVDDKTILDIYFSAPIGSLMNTDKCNLLKLVPAGGDWKSGLIQNLKTQNTEVAKLMLHKLTNQNLTPAKYQASIQDWYKQALTKLAAGDLEPFFTQLLNNRKAVFTSEISKNPKGQIMEPGFRVVFPQPGVALPARR